MPKRKSKMDTLIEEVQKLREAVERSKTTIVFPPAIQPLPIYPVAPVWPTWPESPTIPVPYYPWWPTWVSNTGTSVLVDGSHHTDTVASEVFVQ